MNKLLSTIEKLLPMSNRPTMDGRFSSRNYRRFHSVLVTTILAITLGPLLIVAGLGYSNYNELFRQTEEEQVSWQMGGSIKSIEYMMNNLESMVLFVAKRDRYSELISGKTLEDLFIRLHRQYSFFADLGVIDQQGIQQQYFGPHDLDGADYSSEVWFKAVMAKGVYISKVYTGYRQTPHFAVAVSKLDPETQQRWVLRTTIDAAKLQLYVNTIKTNASDDLFLIDEEGILQTASTYFGETLSRFDGDINQGIRRVVTREGDTVFQAIGPIANTPWSLVLIDKNYTHDNDWKNFRNELLIIILSCLVLAVAIVFTIVTLLVRQLRRADEMQISMLKEAEHTEKLASIGRLAAGVGHEINNPLAIIDQKTGLIEDFLLMSPDFDNKETISDSLKVITQSVGRCKTITHRLLGFARRTSVVNEHLQINQIMGEVLKFLESEMLYNRIKATLHLQEDLPDVLSDKVSLQQVFLNIINNAIDAIGKNGEITIRTNLIAGSIRVIIEDNGPGIDENILPHIFEPFYTTKETGKGTGLGLSITFGLIKKLGGDITVRSQPNQGSAFTITIPQETPHNDTTQS